MKRSGLVLLLILALYSLATPLVANAQPARRVYRIGLLYADSTRRPIRPSERSSTVSASTATP
jgi:hypothetical protein